jgi:predicted CoA-binding protein
MTMTLEEKIEAFLDGTPHAVVGASADRSKYGNKVLRVYQQNDRPVYPVNPKADEIEGLKVYPDLASLPEKPHGVSIITPPKVTREIVKQAADLGIEHLWMQPGAEYDGVVEDAETLGVNVIAGDACALVTMGYRE